MPVASFSQTKELRKKEKEADGLYEQAEYLKAVKLYKEVAAGDTADIRSAYKAGVCLFKLGRMDTMTQKYLLKAVRKFDEAHYFLGRVYLRNNKLYEALHEFLFAKGRYISEFETPQEDIERWAATAKRSIEESLNKQTLRVNNLGGIINSLFPEYSPVLSPDETMLLFTSRREGSTGGEKDPYGNYYEDIYYSMKSDSGWSKAQPFSKNVNTNTHDACVSFTPEGDLIIYRTDAKLTGGDLYISTFNGTEWSVPVIMTGKINSEYQEPSASFSPLSNEVIFSSNKPDGFGGKDLYRITRFSGDMFSNPLNLGQKINTPYDEDAPFITSNDKVLYFSSNGSSTSGGYDIFRSTLNEENGTWGPPEHIGMPLNSTGDDIYFIVTKDGKTAYFASNRPGGAGETDIYEIDMKELENPLTVIEGSLNVEEGKTIDLSSVEITVLVESTGKTAGVYKLAKNYNTFILLVDKSIEYKIVVESPEIEPFVQKIKFERDEWDMFVKKK